MTEMKRRVPRLFVFYLVFSFLCISVVPSNSFAYMAESDAVLNTRAEDSAKIQRLLESKVVAQRLEKLGLSTDEVLGRLDKLTDAELHSFATKADNLYPGAGGTGLIIGILIIVALILLILHLTDHRVIFERN